MSLNKTLAVIALLGSIALGVVFTQSSSAKGTVGVEAANKPLKIFVLKAEGMTCGSCEARITDALRSSEDVGRVAVSISKGLVAVEAVDAPGAAGNLSNTVTDAGYPASHVGFLDSFPGGEEGGKTQSAQSGCGGGCC